jgi:DNA repair exonuclease SbcCD nuclease subunit
MASNQKIRIRFFADTHLGFDYPIKPRITRRRRGQDFFDNFQRVLDGVAAAKIDLLVHGGDLFFRSRIPPKIVDLAYSALFEFAAKGIPILLVPGNHERSRLPASLYLAHPNIYVYAKAMTYTFEVGDRRVCVSGFPFERGDIKQGFKTILNETGWKAANGDLRILCIHQAVEGAQVGPSNYTFRNGMDVIRLVDIPDAFDAILAGHIHRKQILNRSVTPVIYPGSTERTSFAEKDEDKGFCDITFQNNENNSWQIEKLDFIRLPSRPMVDLYLDENVSEDNLIQFLQARVGKIHQDAIVRIRCRGTPDNGLKKRLTSSFLRRVFPTSVNVQLATELRPLKRRNKKQ